MSFFISSFIINFLITKFLIKHSFNLNLIDHPENRKMHTNSMPVVGGLSIFITFSGFYLFWLYSGYLHTLFTSEEIISITISTLIIFLIGLMDDSFGLGPFNKFLFQFIAAIIFMIGLEIDSTHIFPFIDSFFFNFIINIFFVVGITNAFNLLDGLDGLAGGVSLIICFTLFILYLLLGYNIDQLILFIILLGCLSSFLFYRKFISWLVLCCYFYLFC